MTIVLDGSSLTIEKITAIARFGEKVEFAPAAFGDVFVGCVRRMILLKW